MSLRMFVGCVFVLAVPALGQDFRVSTRLFDEHPGRKAEDAAQPVARTCTIFHAGKVYDYNDSVGETTILEPSRNQFVILSKERLLATRLSFDEIESTLYQAEQRARQRVSGPNSEFVQFQLQPRFETTFDDRKKLLRLASPHLSYDVKTAAAEAERLAVYLRYANWTARLNYLLHPQMLPNIRLALNDELEQRTLLPVEIRLQSAVGNGLRLRAEHRYHWSLTSEDRRRISDWEALLQSPTLKFKEFHEFQQEVAAK